MATPVIKRTLVQAFFFYCKNASRHILRFEKRRIREDGNGARPSRWKKDRRREERTNMKDEQKILNIQLN
ncbi:hypothetical protein DI291_06640 [Bacillus paralicheniformis]|nr:hypothetical protein DI291_06640 [Bacillus paralicheniformis]